MPRPFDDPPPRRPAWFWWALANLLALCFAVTSWTLAMEIFGRPDVPHNYRLLLKMNRAPDFKAYSPKGAPEGRLFTPPEIYGWFFDMGDKGHARLNTLYRRNFMRNFDEPMAVTYVEGDFEVLATRPFGKEDFLPEGFAIRSRAMVRPDDFSPEAPYPVVVEVMVPTSDEAAAKRFEAGSRFSLSRAPNLWVVMHVGRYSQEDEPVVQVTVMPIGYGSLKAPSGRPVPLEVPEWVRPEGPLPLFDPESGIPTK